MFYSKSKVKIFSSLIFITESLVRSKYKNRFLTCEDILSYFLLGFLGNIYSLKMCFGSIPMKECMLKNYVCVSVGEEQVKYKCRL